MDAVLSSLLNFYVFSTGRRLFAMQQVHKCAIDINWPELAAHVAMAIDHDKKTRALDFKWLEITKAPKAKRGQSPLQRIDAAVDNTLTAIRDTAIAQTRGAEPNDPIIIKVDVLLRRIFPAGVHAVTSLNYIDELSAVDGILTDLQGPYAGHVAEIGLTRLAQRLATLATEYRAALEDPGADTLNFGTVRAARATGQDCMLQAVAMILGRFPQNTPADIEARTKLLEPILKQNAAIGAYLRARRAVEDLDPETGEIDPNAPPSAVQEG